MCVYLAMFANVHLVHLGNTGNYLPEKLKKKFHEDDMLLVFVGDILPYLLSINNLIVKSCHSSIINQMSKKKFAEKGDKEKKGNHTVGVKTVPMFRSI